MFLTTSILFSALVAASPVAQSLGLDLDFHLDEHVGSETSTNFTLMTRDEFLTKRQPGGVFICPDINWQPASACGYAKQPWNNCIRLDSPWWHTISSIGPDQYNTIVAYKDYNCGSSEKLAIFNPGYADLRQVGWNDQIGSFRVLQIPGKNCIGDADLDNQYLRGTTDCNRCCEGCNLSGNGCCPAGAFC